MNGIHALLTCSGMGRGKCTFTLATNKRAAGARCGPKLCISTGRRAFAARVNSRGVQDCCGDVHRRVFVVLILQRNIVVYRSGVQGFSDPNALKSSQIVQKPRSCFGRLWWNVRVHHSIYKSCKSISAQLLSRTVSDCMTSANKSHVSVSILCADASRRQDRMHPSLQYSVSNSSGACVRPQTCVLPYRSHQVLAQLFFTVNKVNCSVLPYRSHQVLAQLFFTVNKVNCRHCHKTYLTIDSCQAMQKLCKSSCRL